MKSKGGGGAYHDTNLSSHNDESRRGKHGHVLQDEMIKKSTDRWRGEKTKTVTDILPNCLVSDCRQKVIQERYAAECSKQLLLAASNSHRP